MFMLKVICMAHKEIEDLFFEQVKEITKYPTRVRI